VEFRPCDQKRLPRKSLSVHVKIIGSAQTKEEVQTKDLPVMVVGALITVTVWLGRMRRSEVKTMTST
jgi:hypothetical protein